MKKKIILRDLGKTEYGTCLELQHEIVAGKTEGNLKDDVLIVTEHEPVITLGKRGGEEFIRKESAYFSENKVDIVQTERGGLVTCHMPGQAVLYPIINLKNFGLGVKEYSFMLMDVMEDFLSRFNVAAYKSIEYPGVWVGNKKIGNIGLAVKKGVTFHGMSINISNDMDLFDIVTPCGIKGAMATRLADQADGVSFEKAKAVLIESFYSVFEKKCRKVP